MFYIQYLFSATPVTDITVKHNLEDDLFETCRNCMNAVLWLSVHLLSNKYILQRNAK